MSDQIASTRINVGISIIVPTYRERENIPLLLESVERLRVAHDLTLEVLFMDDDSRDGSVEAVEQSGYDWARIIVRTESRGLSPAVVDGFRAAQYPILICMDGDLSHPTEAIPVMVTSLAAGVQFAIGSRYVRGGSTDDDWGLVRWANSLVATLLARPLTPIRDPMSGFFAMRKADFDAACDLNPIGYKIALELIVKCDFENVVEVPIHFSDRVHGESKLSLKEQLRYIQHLRRLYLYKFSNAMYLIQFLVVGASGAVINLAILSLLAAFGALPALALAGGIAVSVVTNFLLNRRFTFSYAKEGNLPRQFMGFLAASAVGVGVNYLVALAVIQSAIGQGAFGLQIAALVGISSGMVFNFLGNRYVVFRAKYYKDKLPRPERTGR